MFILCCPHVCQVVDPAHAGVVGKWQRVVCTHLTSAFEYESVPFCSLICVLGRVSLWTNRLKASKDPQTCKNTGKYHEAPDKEEKWGLDDLGGSWSFSLGWFSKPAIVGRFCLIKVILSIQWLFANLCFWIALVSILFFVVVSFKILFRPLVGNWFGSYKQHGIHIQSSHSPPWYHHLESWGKNKVSSGFYQNQ